MSPRTGPRVLRRLLDATATLPRTRVLGQGTLVELGEVLEKLVLEHDLRGAVLIGVRDQAHWLRSLERHRALVNERARSVTVFAAGLEAGGTDDGIVRVSLDGATQLRDAWFVVVLSDALSAALFGVDLGDAVDEGTEHRFETLVTVDPDLVGAVAAHVRDEVGLFDTAVAARVETALAAFPPAPARPALADELLGGIVDVLERTRLGELEMAAVRQQAVDELVELDRVRTGFLRAVSHELRTPATIVHGMAETLQRLGPHLSPLQRERFGDSLLQHSDRLRVLLDDLLDVDRLSRGVMAPAAEPVDAAAVVRAAIAMTTSSRRVVQTGLDRLEVPVDRIQLERIVVNLVTNAEKYAPEGGITVDVDGDGAAGMLLRVSDEGPGIPGPERERVFQPFHRLDHAHPRPGTGIGLTLVSEFARLHGGSAGVEETPGGGACLVVHLPGTRVHLPGE